MEAIQWLIETISNVLFKLRLQIVCAYTKKAGYLKEPKPWCFGNSVMD